MAISSSVRRQPTPESSAASSPSSHGGSENLRRRTLHGGALLGIQRIVAIFISALGGIALARLLLPELFGLYTVAWFVVNLAVALGDVGLGTVLVQRRTIDENQHVARAFTVGLCVGVLVAGLVWGLAPLAVSLLGLDEQSAGLIRCLAVLALFAAFRMPPAVLLERRLDYRALTIADLAEISTYYAVAILTATAGLGVWSLVIGAVLSKVVSVGLLWKMAGWSPRLQWQWKEIGVLLRAGMPIQGACLSVTLRDVSMPVIVTPWSGVVGVGYLNWAGTLAFLPLQLVSLAGKVLLPSLARLQGDAGRFALATEQAINRVAVFLFPAILFLMAAADPLVSLVYGSAWVPAVPALYLYGVAAAVGGLSNLCIHALYGLGRSREVFWLNVIWAALVWCLSLLFVPWWGFTGFAAASACAAALSISVLWVLRRTVPLHLSRAIGIPFCSAAVVAALLYVACQLFVRDLFGLALSGALALVCHLLLAAWLAGPLWRAGVWDDLRTALGARL